MEEEAAQYPKPRGKRRLLLIVASAALLVFTIYLAALYRQLEGAFHEAREFIPTRIFSDATRIAPPQSRSYVLSRLRDRGYKASNAGDSLIFTPRKTDYPAALLPEGHPQGTALQGVPVELEFDGEAGDSILEKITWNDGEDEVDSIFLEPVLVATLSRAGEEDRGEIRTSMPFRDIPAPVWKSIIAVEDQHFLDHRGLDPRGLARALWVNLKSLSLKQGGSTITQQLVKNLMARRTKNVFKKVNEIFLALILEARYDKEEILERYLNEVYLGQIGSLEIHGVYEGARHFFGKTIQDLNLAEIALMTGLIRGPGFYSPYRHMDRAVTRQKFVLERMVETGHLAPEEKSEAERQPIRLLPPHTASNRAPYFTDYVKAELISKLKDRLSEEEISDAGFKVYTTLDLRLNEAAQAAVGRGVTALEKRHGIGAEVALQGALAAVDHSNGFIRALIGGRDYTRSTFNRILNMRRQVGSTFKPVVYLAAFLQGNDPSGVPYGGGYPIEDGPWKLVYDNERQSWEPTNYDPGYRGYIPLRTALAHSINTAAARLGARVGIRSVIDAARALGVSAELPEVPSLALGVCELSPVELLRAYATIANRGLRDELTVIRAIARQDGDVFARFEYNPGQAVPSGPIDLLTDMLQDVFAEGTAAVASKMGFERMAAGKTGTTSNHRDAWFAGFTPQLTTVVWVGPDQATPPPAAEGEEVEETQAPKLTGAGAALPIWVDFMNRALAGMPPEPFPPTETLVDLKVDKMSGKPASSECPSDQVIEEKYVAGAEGASEGCARGWPAPEPLTRID